VDLAPGGEFNRNFTLADFQKDPGYQFRMDQGQQALERSAAAGGGLLSGGTGKACSNTGRTMPPVSIRTPTTDSTTTRRLDSIGCRLLLVPVRRPPTRSPLSELNTASNIGENYLQAGNASAANYVGQGNAINNGVSSLGNFYLQQQYLNKMPSQTQGP
jgi:hypothetical protein